MAIKSHCKKKLVFLCTLITTVLLLIGFFLNWPVIIRVTKNNCLDDKNIATVYFWLILKLQQIVSKYEQPFSVLSFIFVFNNLVVTTKFVIYWSLKKWVKNLLLLTNCKFYFLTVIHIILGGHIFLPQIIWVIIYFHILITKV